MPRSERSRSRSPLHQNEESQIISRAIAGFGSNPESRPTGLQAVDGNAFRLVDLMNTWGEHEGLRERDILHAARAHMFHEDGQLRFAIDADRRGHIIIRVLLKRTGDLIDSAMPGSDDRMGDDAVGLAAPVLANRTADSSAEQNAMLPSVEPGAQRVVSVRGTVRQEMIASMEGKAAQTKPSPADSNGSSKAKNPQERLEMSLDDVIQAGDGGEERRASRGDRTRRAFDQMGLTRDSRHTRRSPRRVGSRSRERDVRRHSDRRQYSTGEKVQRWLGWMFAKGFKELDVRLEAGGWAKLDTVASAMRISRRDFDEFDGPKLRMLLETTDEVGRFELDMQDRLRKLPKDTRPADMRRSDKKKNGNAVADDSMRTEDGNRRIEIGGSGQNNSRKPPQISREVITIDSPEPERGGDAKAAPPKPPGDNWSRYQDDGSFWWYYSGPLGVWWWSEELPAPKEYNEDDD